MSKSLIFAATVAVCALAIAPTGTEAFSRTSKLDKIAQAISKTPISPPVALVGPHRSTKGLFEEKDDDEVQGFTYRKTSASRSSPSVDWSSSSNILNRGPSTQVWNDESEDSEQRIRSNVRLVTIGSFFDAFHKMDALFEEESEEDKEPQFFISRPQQHVTVYQPDLGDILPEEASDEDEEMAAPASAPRTTQRYISLKTPPTRFIRK